MRPAKSSPDSPSSRYQFRKNASKRKEGNSGHVKPGQQKPGAGVLSMYSKSIDLLIQLLGDSPERTVTPAKSPVQPNPYEYSWFGGTPPSSS